MDYMLFSIKKWKHFIALRCFDDIDWKADIKLNESKMLLRRILRMERIHWRRSIWELRNVYLTRLTWNKSLWILTRFLANRIVVDTFVQANLKEFLSLCRALNPITPMFFMDRQTKMDTKRKEFFYHSKVFDLQTSKYWAYLIL